MCTCPGYEAWSSPHRETAGCWVDVPWLIVWLLVVLPSKYMFPFTSTVPATWSFCAGLVVPIPTLPVFCKVSISVKPETADPVECVEKPSPVAVKLLNSKRSELAELIKANPSLEFLNNKLDAWKIESGKNNLTNFFKHKNYKVFIIISDIFILFVLSISYIKTS